MHRLNEIAAKLTPSQIKEVEDFAEFLLDREKHTTAGISEGFLDVSKIAGMFPQLAPGKSAVELSHEATESRAVNS